eukprot:120309-Amorphochlora_amoeboformis.AAC.1
MQPLNWNLFQPEKPNPTPAASIRKKIQSKLSAKATVSSVRKPGGDMIKRRIPVPGGEGVGSGRGERKLSQVGFL